MPKKKKYLLLFITLLTFNHLSYGQGGFRARCYSPAGNTHVTKDVFETSLGKYLALGISIEKQAGIDVFLFSAMELNSQGKVQWIKNYGRKNLQYGTHPFTIRNSIKQGNYLYYTGSLIDSNQKAIGTLLKLDFNGNIIWQKLYTDTLSDVVPQMISNSTDNGFLITGFYQDKVNGGSPAFLIKTDANGNELWRKFLTKSHPNVSDGKAILQDSASKKIVLVGYQYTQPINSVNQWTTKDNIVILDSLGTLIQRITLHEGTANDVIQTKDKKIVVVGNNRQYIDGIPVFTSFALKFDINNPTALIWHLDKFGALTNVNSFNTVNELPDGNLIIGGTYDSLVLADKRNNGWSRFVWLSPGGQVLKQKYYDYAPDKIKNNVQWLTCLNLTSDGGWITSLRCDYYPNNPMYCVKYDNQGCDSTSYYCATIGVNELNIFNENLKIYPNPASDVLTIEQNAEDRELDLSVIDLLGKEVKRLRFKNKAELDLRDLNAGIYFVELRKEGQLIGTKKIVKE